MSVESHNLSRDAGDGSAQAIDDKYDGEEYTTKDQRADTWTTFYKSDIDSLQVSERRKKELRRALERQRGIDYGEGTSADRNRRHRKQQNREEYKRRVVSVYASQLDLNKRQAERTGHLFLEVLDINSFGHYATEEIALAVINCVVREDGWLIEEDANFHRLMREVGLETDGNDPDLDAMRRLRGMVRERVPSMD